MKPLRTNLMDLLFGCWHRRLSFPMTVTGKQRRLSGEHAPGTYVVCLDCGREFAYDWEEMQVVSEGAPQAHCPSLEEVESNKAA